MSAFLTWSALAVAGGLGAGARFVVDRTVTRALAGRMWALPVGIATVNVTGSALIGIVAALGADQGMWSTIVATGFCGGYTTFSTAMADSVHLVRTGRRAAGLVTLVGPLGASIAALSIAAALTHRLIN